MASSTRSTSFPLELPESSSLSSPSLPIGSTSSQITQAFPPLQPQREPLPVSAYRPYSAPPRTRAERLNAFLFRDPPEGIRRLQQPLLLVSLTGFLIGALKGGRKSSLIFTAENAHRKPQNKNQWYYYRKTKNYHIVLGALPVAFRWAWRLSVLTATFISLEYAFDKAWSVAQRWQDEDALARSMVRDYGLGEEPAKPLLDSSEQDGWWEKEIPRRQLLKHSASGAASGAILGLAFSMWNRFYTPLTRKVVAGSFAVGAVHGYVYPLGRQAQLVEQQRMLDIHGPLPVKSPLPSPEQYAEIERQRKEDEEREFEAGWREARKRRWIEKGGREDEFEKVDVEVMRLGREVIERRARESRNG